MSRRSLWVRSLAFPRFAFPDRHTRARGVPRLPLAHRGAVEGPEHGPEAKGHLPTRREPLRRARRRAEWEPEKRCRHRRRRRALVGDACRARPRSRRGGPRERARGRGRERHARSRRGRPHRGRRDAVPHPRGVHADRRLGAPVAPRESHRRARRARRRRRLGAAGRSRWSHYRIPLAFPVASSGRHRVGGVRRRRRARPVLALRGVPRASASSAAGRRARLVAAGAEGRAFVRRAPRHARVSRLGDSASRRAGRVRRSRARRPPETPARTKPAVSRAGGFRRLGRLSPRARRRAQPRVQLRRARRFRNRTR